MLSNSNAQMQVEDTPLSSDDLGLPLWIQSEDDEDYRVELTSTGIREINLLWQEMLRVKESLSPVGEVDSLEKFTKRIFLKDSVFLDIYHNDQKIGLAYASEIHPGYSARFSYLFWDRKTSGRQRLVLSLMKWFEKEFSLTRFEIRIHAFATYALHRLFKIGVFYEGTKRRAFQGEGKMINLHIFSILSHELTEANLEAGFIRRSKNELGWYKKLC